MNKTSIKNYAIWARNELISRVSQKAFEYGVEKDNIIPSDVDSINGRLLSEDEKKKRQTLVGEVKRKGYEQVIEEVAYTWFNRFIALRFMEVNNYLPNRVRLFTNENNEFKPQIIDEALHIELTGLDKNKVIALKEKNNNEELYKELLLATCNDMSRYLPGMFKPISDYMTLLFPSNLLREESVLGRLLSGIDEDSWTDQVQIIGWLYQYYNTEPKDQTFANLKKNIKINKDTIAPATQLFTPDWIVRYMTENSLGRLWLDGHPDNHIKTNWKYYLDEAEQEESVQIELNKIKAEHSKLNPEDIKFLDPCMGSGHILVYAFDVFMQIYRSEGWTEREAAKSILRNNIYGLDIDERAYQLSYFALMMKARQYNRRILSEGILPNVMAIEESNTFNKDLLKRFGELRPLAERVVNTFIDAKEYGSILNVEFTKEELDSLERKLNEIDQMADYGNLLDQLDSEQLLSSFYPLLKQAIIMSQKYECVVTNPPYMASSGMGIKLSGYVKKYYPDSKSDLFSVFIEKCGEYSKLSGFQAMITQHTWMFLGSYENLRRKIQYTSLESLVHLGIKAFEEIGNDVVQTASFVIRKEQIKNKNGVFIRLVDYKEYSLKEKEFFNSNNRHIQNISSFSLIPGFTYAYWVDKSFIDNFAKGESIEKYGEFTGSQNITGDNEKYLRCFWEVDATNIGTEVWVFYAKGGDYRKYYGNLQMVVDWRLSARNFYSTNKTSNLLNEHFWFREGVTYSAVTSRGTGFRYLPKNCVFDKGGPSIALNSRLIEILALLNSKVAELYFQAFNPSINLQVKDIKSLPVILPEDDSVRRLGSRIVELAKNDWNDFETSYEFHKHSLLNGEKSIKHAFEKYQESRILAFTEAKKCESEINAIYCKLYDLTDLEISFEDRDIPVRLANLQREVKSLISYAIGCMFGRYSLDVDGLAYAGGEWDGSKYRTFIPDKDNIIPICDDEYFADDIVGRFIEFIKVAYGEDTLEENLRFIADTLGGKGTSREVIRSYFINDFYKDHCNTYQVTGSGKRPIYWQFDSGKKNGFKALIYIHRYTPDLIARMRTSYVHEQQSRYDNQMSMIQNRIDSATSTSERVKAEKEMKKLKDQAEELRVYEEKIHHWADKMEPMDLDDGVKANYAKFQELLTKIK